MKRLLLIIVIQFFFGSLSAQSIPKILELADEQFENNRFLEAIPYYEKVYAINKTDYYAGFQMAVCFELSLQYEEAIKTFKVLSDIQGHEYQPQSIYKYATLNKLEGHFDLADSIYQELVKMEGIAPALLEQATRQREGCIIAKKAQAQDRHFTTEFVKKLNSNYHDFGATQNPKNGDVVFATSRNLSGTQYQGSQYSGLLPDMMTFEVKDNGNYHNISGKHNFDRLNTKWSEGSGTFNSSGDKFYYTSCENDEGSSGCQIMMSILVNDKWSKSEALNEFVNEKNSENKQPSLSVTGDTLFFSSDRAGGQGGSDIWMSLRGDEGESWLPAINMGNVINTPDNEITPYYSSKHQSLLFSSNGHVGYGGYDIYGAKGHSFFKPDLFNVGFPFNSTWDDTYFNIVDTVGYLSSNKKNMEVLDIYRFSVPDEKLFLSLLFAGELMVDGQIMSKYRDVGAIDLVTFRAEDYEGYALFQPVITKKKDLRKLYNTQAVDDGSIASNLVATRSARSTRVKQRSNDAVKPVSVTSTTYKTFDNVERLYFDYGDYELRKQSKQAIRDFYNSISNQPYTKVNLLSYSDHHGSKNGNVALCEKRGLSVKEFLVILGLPEDKIQVMARGELRSETDRDHWFRRVLDRRVELHVETVTPIALASARGVVLRKPLSLDEVAVKLNLDAKEVHKWNGPGHQVITPGHAIRLYIPASRKLDPRYFITEENIWVAFKD